MAEQGLFTVIVQGCNCLNTMGAGIAAEIKQKYPAAYDADTLATEQWKIPEAKLGNFSTAAVTYGKIPFIIVNAYTQVNFEPRGIDHFEYESFSLILRKLLSLANEGVNFGFPYIGMGLAGGDKERIITMLENFAVKATEKGATATLVEFAP